MKPVVLLKTQLRLTTYELDGIQYITITASWGGVAGLNQSYSQTQTTGKVYTFRLGGNEQLPEFIEKVPYSKLSGVNFQIESEADVMLGAKLYINNCYICHRSPAYGQGGRIPNLGYSQQEVIQNLEAYVLNRALASTGMPDFSGRLSENDVVKIKAFIQISSDAYR